MIPEPAPREIPAAADDGASLLAPLLHPHADGQVEPGGIAASRLQGPMHGMLTGTLLALTDNGRTALVGFDGQPGHAALRAQCTVDLQGTNIGHRVVLMFDGGDLHKPVVMGVLRGQEGWPLQDRPATVDLDADGERMIVSAKSQLILRCGNASITLTHAGKVLISGSYVLTRSSGMNRVEGASVQIN